MARDDDKVKAAAVPFDVLQAAFKLMAFVIVLSLLSTLAEGIKCLWIGATTAAILECKKIELREFVLELLAVILVLLNAKKQIP